MILTGLGVFSVPDLEVLRIDDDGTNVLKFSDVFWGHFGRFSTGLKRSISQPRK